MGSGREDYIAALEAEVDRLKGELEAAGRREHELEDTRRAMLYLLEDINETSAGIQKAKAEWEATFDSISDPLFIHDTEMRILRCNNAYSRVAGLPYRDIIGKHYYEVFPRMNGPLKSCLEALESPEEGVEEEEVTDPESNRVYKARVYSRRNAGGVENFSIHIMEDITETKRAEEKEKILYGFAQRAVSNMDVNYRLRALCEAAVEFGFKMAWIGFLNEQTSEVTPVASMGDDDGYLSSIKVRYDDSPLGQGPVGRAVRSGKCQVQNNIATDEGFAPWKEAALARGFKSCAVFPMMEEESIAGVLCIYSTNSEFPEKDVDFLRAFANQAAIYIKNANLFAEVKESAEKVRLEMELTRHLLTLSDATAHTTDIGRLMEQVVESVQSIMGATVCLSYLLDTRRGTFQPSQASGLAPAVVPLFRVEALDVNNPLVESALCVKGTLIERVEAACPETGCDQAGAVQDAASKDFFRAFRTYGEISTIAVIPLLGREGCLGLLFCLYETEPGAPLPLFTGRETALMNGVAHQVSTALEEARLYKESIDKTMELSRNIETIQAMHEIDRHILSTLEPEEILETAVMMIGKLMYCDRATVALADREAEGFAYSAGFGVESLRKRDLVPFSDTSAYEVFKTCRPQYVPNVEDAGVLLPLEKRFLEEGFLSHIRVPLVVKGEAVGVLTVGSKRQAAFRPEDLSILEKIASQISVALENSRLLTDLEGLFIGVVRTLSIAIDAKSPWTRGHSDRVTGIAMDIGRQMNLPETELKSLELAGLLHDIGKLGTYEHILDKPGALTDEEMEVIKQHPGKGADILAPIKQMEGISPAIRHHHEYYDGSGYPDGLYGTEIPLLARILAVADTVDAMGADRPYRKGRPIDVIVSELKRCSGTQFDPAVVDAFLETLEVEEVQQKTASNNG